MGTRDRVAALQASCVACHATLALLLRRLPDPAHDLDDGVGVALHADLREVLHDHPLERRAAVGFTIGLLAVPSAALAASGSKSVPSPMGGNGHNVTFDGRLFLVVSSEFAGRLRRHTRHGLKLGKFHYREVKHDGATRMFEVCKGPASTSS